MGIVSNGYNNSWAANKRKVIQNLCHTLWQHEPSSVWWGVEPLTSPESETSISDSIKDTAMFGWQEKNCGREKKREQEIVRYLSNVSKMLVKGTLTVCPRIQIEA